MYIFVSVNRYTGQIKYIYTYVHYIHTYRDASLSASAHTVYEEVRAVEELRHHQVRPGCQQIELTINFRI